ncbi:MAG: gamma-glutamylcyclotransferase [Gammaproteobacteria bacterium]|nr:gamma-glutamylcyclotransferase [Gammaproteobacteria bacterium]|tara:strand:- start:4768 stop:5133 length:366 start_codon:yes stop_codon:yes gene_type:complete
MSTLVAVYGTLKRGLSNDHYLQAATYLGNDTLTSISLYDLGAYPGAKAEPSAGIDVEIFSVTAQQLQALDGLEEYEPAARARGLYDRRQFTTRYGTAWVYLYNPSVSGLMPMRAGGWQPTT